MCAISCHRPSRAEEELRGKQLKAWCGMLLENHEEQVVEALAKDQFTVEGMALSAVTSWWCGSVEPCPGSHAHGNLGHFLT